MPRTPRKKSSTGIYHVMLRGADRRVVFSDDEDCIRFLETMKRAKRESGFRLFAWCLMGNHVQVTRGRFFCLDRSGCRMI